MAAGEQNKHITRLRLYGGGALCDITESRAGSLQEHCALLRFMKRAASKGSEGTYETLDSCVQQNKAMLKRRRRCLLSGKAAGETQRRGSARFNSLQGSTPSSNLIHRLKVPAQRRLAAYFTRRLEGGTLDSTCPDPRNLTSHLTC